MRILDFYPSQGSLAPGELVTFLIELESPTSQAATVRISIQHLLEMTIVIEKSVALIRGEQTIQMQWILSNQLAGYSAQLEVATKDTTAHASTAFDVLTNWTDFPRYGFLTDFSASRTDPETALKELTRFHLNGLQFYDWQYRHDQLLAPTDDYIDPLGRAMSLTTVRKLVDAAHKHGMAAMPYLAVYAASADFWNQHLDWALYDEKGNPIPFGENFLGLMNPAKDSPWSSHLLAEGSRTLQAIPFDGLHIDQYGEPKQVWDAKHQPVDLPQAFAQFIQAADGQHPDKAILFNAVGNWPIEALAAAPLDVMYIEVWPPSVEYRQLAEIVLNAVRLSHGKPVIIALYLPSKHPDNNLLADAVILACGGMRIELGESTRLLSDPYFPKHEAISPKLQSQLRSFYDFAVRNGEWLMSYNLSTEEKNVWAEGELNPSFVSADESLWTVARKYPHGWSVRVLNVSGLDSHPRWDQPHGSPKRQQKVAMSIKSAKRPLSVIWDCPEQSQPQEIQFDYQGGIVTCELPQIQFLGLLIIHE